MYIILTPRRVASFFERFSPFTHTIRYRYRLINRCQPVPVRFSGPELFAPQPAISIRRTAIVVVRTPYIWSYISVLLYRWDFGLGNGTRDMLPVFWSPHQGAGTFFWDLQFQVGSEPPGARKTLRKIHWSWPRFEPGPPN